MRRDGMADDRADQRRPSTRRPADSRATASPGDWRDWQRVGAHRHERPVADRDLACVADEDVEAERADDRDPHEMATDRKYSWSESGMIKKNTTASAAIVPRAIGSGYSPISASYVVFSTPHSL